MELQFPAAENYVIPNNIIPGIAMVMELQSESFRSNKELTTFG